MEPPSPLIDSRSYQALFDESLARIPVHTPEWTNFNRSDPGVTLVEVFAFLTENLLYRANQIPERNRRKFLSLLGVPLQPASSARGIITINNQSGPLQTETLNAGVEVTAKTIPFRTERGLDVLPVESRVFYKQTVTADPSTEEYYRQLYASYFDPASAPVTKLPHFYKTVPLVLHGGKTGALNEFGVNPGVDLADNNADSSLWIALLLRKADAGQFDQARAALAGKTISLGIVPWLEDDRRSSTSTRQLTMTDVASLLRFEMPAVPPNGKLHTGQGQDKPNYRSLPARAFSNVLEMPGTIELTLPAAPEDLRLWNDLDPLDPGVDDLPPSLEDTNLADRVITWVRVRAPTGAKVRILWCDINATTIIQRSDVAGELVGTGTGEPDQSFKLVNTPVVPGSATVTITPVVEDNQPKDWHEIDDLFAADPEVLAPDLRLPPGNQIARRADPQLKVFVLDAVSGTLVFGDGAHGRRPPFGSIIRANYAFSSGSQGNVAAGAINKGSLPDGFVTANPVRTWGGADAETVTQGEKQIASYLQHRDRLITVQDFDNIVRRTPGVQIGRLDVLPTYHPESQATGGYAPGAVTLLLLPQNDPDHPDAPKPDRIFMNAVCDYVSDRRLVTTEVILRGPSYVKIYVSVGLELEDGATAAASATVRETVRQAIRDFLSPYTWRLNKDVLQIELLVAAARVSGVQGITGLKLARETGAEIDTVQIRGLELPQLAGLIVTVGDPASIDEVRGAPNPDAPATPTDAPGTVVIPVVPEECR